MVFVNDKKYSCEACIKGHRSSSCKHTDRPLFEIKKKGRPITQCEHCRELRKTKQVHIKCSCQSKTPIVPDEKGKKAQLKRALATPAYPHGLPESLEGVVVSKPSSESSSDSDHSSRVNAQSECSCKDNGDCHCYTVKHRPRSKAVGSDPGPSSLDLASLSRRRGSATASFRPVLPKPANPPTGSQDSPMNISVLAPRPHIPRPTHGNTYYSPYERAYNEHFSADRPQTADNMPDIPSYSATSTIANSPVVEAPVVQPSSVSPLPGFPQWQTPIGAEGTSAPFCACGEGCSCPGCVEHQGASAWFTRECSNPGVCTTCFTCLTNPRPLPPPAPTPPTTPLGGRLGQQFESFEQWLGNMSTDVSSFFPDFDLTDLPPSSFNVSQTMDIDIDRMLGLPAYCSGLCIPGQCTCSPNCSTGCQDDMDVFSQDANMSAALDLDAGASTPTLPELTPRGRSSSMSALPLDFEATEFMQPKASSTTSLLPLSPASAGPSSVMARVFPMRNTPGPTVEPNQHVRNSHSRQRRESSPHNSSLFFEAAARRFGG